jgi:hypothetical protein
MFRPETNIAVSRRATRGQSVATNLTKQTLGFAIADDFEATNSGLRQPPRAPCIRQTHRWRLARLPRALRDERRVAGEPVELGMIPQSLKESRGLVSRPCPLRRLANAPVKAAESLRAYQDHACSSEMSRLV